MEISALQLAEMNRGRVAWSPLRAVGQQDMVALRSDVKGMIMFVLLIQSGEKLRGAEFEWASAQC